MHDIKSIRDNPQAFDDALARRGLAGEAQRLIAIDEGRRSTILELETARKQQKEISSEVQRATKAGAINAVAALRDNSILLRTKIQQLEEKKITLEKELNDALAEIPNLPLEEVPDGKDEHDNVEHHHFGAKRNYAFAPKQHFELGETLGQMNFETAAKLSGARFVVLKSGLAKMERALGQFMLDVHTTDHGYTEVAPPLLVRDEVMFGTAQLPKFKDDQFSAKAEQIVGPEEFDIEISNPGEISFQFKGPRAKELQQQFLGRVYLNSGNAPLKEQVRPIIETARWLIPTAEVPLTNLVRESILDEAELPMRLTACTPCFRAEAGAAGKDTRGMIRQHQFTKVELVSITTPEQSKDEHERMLACAEEVLRRLDLHYRVVTLCTGDMGFAAQKTYDIEVWLPGQNMYREISSCSNCGAFQARRMFPSGRGPSEGTRYRAKDGKIKGHVHTLNGSGVAVGRALIAVMETYQQDGGAIAVPDALQNYMGGVKTIERAQ